jgi:hypothetical protein
MRLTRYRRVEADYLQASFDYERWTSDREDVALRRHAVDALGRFHEAAVKGPQGLPFAIEAAHRVATMLRAGGDPAATTWWRTTLADWELLAAHPQPGARATDAPYADYGAEADFVLVDQVLRGRFDVAAGRPRYRGSVSEVRAQLDRDLDAATRTWTPRLDRVATRYGSFEWATAATAREGSLFDAIRTGLDLAVPTYLTPRQRTAFDAVDEAANRLDAGGHAAAAAALRQRLADADLQIRDAWRAVKDRYLDGCSRAMVGKYASAAVAARAHDLVDPTVKAALDRLAYYADYLGDDALRPYVEATPDPTSTGRRLGYADGQFLRWRSGIDATPPPSASPPPAPAAP